MPPWSRPASARAEEAAQTAGLEKMPIRSECPRCGGWLDALEWNWLACPQCGWQGANDLGDLIDAIQDGWFEGAHHRWVDQPDHGGPEFLGRSEGGLAGNISLLAFDSEGQYQ